MSNVRLTSPEVLFKSYASPRKFTLRWKIHYSKDRMALVTSKPIIRKLILGPSRN